MSNPIENLRLMANLLRTAAQRECIEPDGPLGAWVDAQYHALMANADVAEHQQWLVTELLARLKEVAEEELARQRVVTHETRIALTEARGAVQNLELEKDKVTAQLINRIVPEMIQGTKAALVIRERRYNRNFECGRAFAAGALMLGLVLFGYGWGTWSDWGMSSRLESVGSAVERCQLTSKWTDDKGHRLCELSDFVRNERVPVRAGSPDDQGP